jgi:predicted transcriptional regulator of viral defense system
MNHEPAKTLGRQAARLLMELHEQGKTVFSHADVEQITGLQQKSARNFVASLVNRGIATRLKPGLFILVPFELGREREYFGSPLVVARELADGADYYVSHASAMDVHQMVTQPQLVVYATSPKAIRPRTVLGTEFRFVRCKPAHLFGLVDHWATKTDKVHVSDLERTVIDGLKQPEYCGGFTMRRLGYLLETFEVDAPRDLERLRLQLTASYALLDPMLPAEGKPAARWRLTLNVDPEEIQAAVRT